MKSGICKTLGWISRNAKYQDNQSTNQTKTAQNRCWWLILIILATWEAEIGGSQFQSSPGKLFARPYLKKYKALVLVPSTVKSIENKQKKKKYRKNQALKQNTNRNKLF
jgi:hypothetical protein